ncbi:hypothetical protein [Cellulomonas sp. ATA003]|uniref:hypothetical protein n=1 Tax=Cellulomonas sp. ATA003 TaxID=3073064 RepID=UPI00287340C8|nr:hypothetical protein [Cellulomonas sp. ATA003]WNB84284.1 hypothetical protein REH70_10280 [Cellulomonas sp. ATA003]
MSPSQRDMRDVVLHDDPGSPGSDDPAPPVGAPPRRAWLTPRRLWALAAVLVLAVAVAAVVDSRRSDAALVDLRGLPGVLAPVDGPVRELWRADGLSMWQTARIDGLLVGPAQIELGRVDAVGLAEATGAVVWRTPLVTEGERAGGVTCAVPEVGGPAGRRTVRRHRHRRRGRPQRGSG